MREHRTINFKLRPLVTNEEYAEIKNTYDFLAREYHKLLYTFNKQSFTKQDLNKFKFRDLVLSRSGKSYLKWDLNNKSKFYRVLLNECRKNLLSQWERREISRIITNHNYTNNQSLWDDLNKSRLYPTAGMVRNIIAAKGKTTFNVRSKFVLDYSTEDNQLSIISLSGKDRKVSIRINTGISWVGFTVSIPLSFKAFDSVARPRLFVDNDGDLVLSLSFGMIVGSGGGSRIMGVDIGKINVFVGRVLDSSNGQYSSPLHASRETVGINKKLGVLEQEIIFLREKMRRIERLLVNNPDLGLAYRWLDLDKRVGLLRNKTSRLKVTLARLAARDIISHAVRENVSVIHLEDLRWLDSSSGKWGRSFLQGAIRDEASLAGIVVCFVNAMDSSHTDPFNGKTIVPRADRQVSTIGGIMDRDACAALELAFRKPSSHSSIVAVSRPVRCRDKNKETPKRPRAVKRKRVLKEGRKKGVYPTGLYKTVAISDSARVTTLLKGTKSETLFTSVSYNQLL